MSQPSVAKMLAGWRGDKRAHARIMWCSVAQHPKSTTHLQIPVNDASAVHEHRGFEDLVHEPPDWQEFYTIRGVNGGGCAWWGRYNSGKGSALPWSSVRLCVMSRLSLSKSKSSALKTMYLVGKINDDDDDSQPPNKQ